MNPPAVSVPAAVRERRARNLVCGVLFFVAAAAFAWAATMHDAESLGGGWQNHFTTFKWICEVLTFSLLFLTVTQVEAARAQRRPLPRKAWLCFAAMLAATAGLIYFEYKRDTRIADPWALIFASLASTAAGVWFLIRWIRGTAVTVTELP